MKKQPPAGNRPNQESNKDDHVPVPFDDALRRILSAPPQPKKAKEPEKAKKK